MNVQAASTTRPETSLKVVSFHGLSTHDSGQIGTLLDACTTDGAFFLDLRDSTAEGKAHEIIKMAAEILRPFKKVFDLPMERKLQWEMDKWGDMQTGGYKPAGKHSGVVEGKRDGFENFLVPWNALAGLGPNQHYDWPPPLSSQLPNLTKFELACQEISLVLLSTLTKALVNRVQVPFENLHRKDQASTTSLACLKYLPSPALTQSQVGHMAHTDVGSLTLLFTSSPGLQVYQKSSSTWLPATPRPECVVVNVGDTLRFMSDGILKSCLHRVVPSVGPDGISETRYALAFFQRPELAARFVDGKGKLWTGEEWHTTKYKVFRAENIEQRQSSLLTGTTGYLGGWKGSYS